MIRYLRYTRLRKAQRPIRRSIRETLAAGKPLKLVVGAGRPRFEGWVHTDLPALDVSNADHWRYLVPKASIDRILAEHVFEHLTAAQLGEFLDIAKPYLAPGGRVRIAVPDGNHPDDRYIEKVKPQGRGAGAEDHKVLYTSEMISAIIREHGYQFQLLEYFNADGQFHRLDWSAEDGIIRPFRPCAMGVISVVYWDIRV